jgi:hypothetical protein
VPVTVTPVVPTIPLVGDTVTLGFTVNVALAVLADASVAVTVWAPWAEAGTVNAQVKLPAAEVVSEPEVHVRAVEPQRRVMADSPA